MKYILFCNIAYMQYYDVELREETPKYGGQYVTNTGDAEEKYNYHICKDGRIRGFVETKHRNKKANQIRIENIDIQYKNANKIDGVTVVFCAYSDKLKKNVIVGWYKEATIYRERAEYNGRQYNIECDGKNATLLFEKEQNKVVPRANKHTFGFGQSNIWYAKEEQATNYVNEIFDYINEYHKTSLIILETMPQIISEEYNESGIGKKVLVNKYERNPIARKKCIELKGTSCSICGFNAAEVYGEEFKDKIEVHHITPINEIPQDYKINPAKDLIPVCPNCHMMLHTKMSNGKFPTETFLKELLNQRHKKL